MGSRLRRLLYKRDAALTRAKRALPAAVRRNIRRLLSARKAVVSRAFTNTQLPTPELVDEYHRLIAANVADVLLKIMNRFYTDLGVDGRTIPLVKALESFRRELPADNVAPPGEQTKPLLIQFERAFALAEAGRIPDALSLFEVVFRNPVARNFVSYDPYVKEAIVRSGEFLGRYHEKRGDVDVAIAIYRQILSMEPDGLVARRLTLILSRRGEFREAAEFAEIASLSKLNLFPRIPENNRYIAMLETEFVGK
jgi:tetratricopeptide (TPR) repeat protein